MRVFKSFTVGVILLFFWCGFSIAEDPVTKIQINVKEFTLKNGRRIYLLAKGRLVNLASAEGHPSEVMDMSFANQFLSLIRCAKEGRKLSIDVHDIPPEQDQELGRLKLKTMGIKIDKLTLEQKKYHETWDEGT